MYKAGDVKCYLINKLNAYCDACETDPPDLFELMAKDSSEILDELNDIRSLFSVEEMKEIESTVPFIQTVEA